MAKFNYAKDRIMESIQFLSGEIKEFETDYAAKTMTDYQSDKKVQKLMDRTLENILTTLIEICGTVLIEEGITVENYSEALRKCGGYFGFTEAEKDTLAKLAFQRNRLAHRYLNMRWQAIAMYKTQRGIVNKLIECILKREEEKAGAEADSA